MKHLTDENVKGKVLDHLGLVSAVIEKLGLIEKVNARLPLKDNMGVKTTMGQRVSAMILNGLGFMNDRLYMFETFLKNKPVDRLFGSNIKAEYFNDDALGRCLDAISEYGTTKFFTEISFEIGLEHKLIGSTMRGDTTTLLVHGEYPEETDANEETEEEKPQPKRGHSKAKRPDLKQMVLHLATTGSSGFPIWMEPHSGNASDKKTLIEAAQRMQAFSKELNMDKDFLYVGDSAFYSGAVKNGNGMKWLSRVPENITEAKTTLERSADEIDWIDLEDGYKMHALRSEYGGVNQRWILIHSDQAYERESKTLEKNIEKESDQVKKALWHLGNQIFDCKKDAEKAAKALKTPNYHKVTYEIEEVKKHAKKGRPKKGETPSSVGFKANLSSEKDEEKIDCARRKKGRFILATNQLDSDLLPDNEILVKYKEQSSTESGFEFIKNNAFEVDSIFLKKPSRIAALMAIMCLCLMVYGFSQYEFRNALKEENESIPDQRKKETQKPRMQWVYRLFHGVQVLTISVEKYTQELVINLNQTLKKIIRFFGPRAMEIYSVQ